jgi:hypothetical protein
MSLSFQTTPFVRGSLQRPVACVDPTQLVVKQVREQLAQSHHRSLRGVGCEPIEGSFVLWGTVSSYYAKQLAQVLA